MASVAGDLPKEMLPVGGRPVVEEVARECAASGITDLLVVIAPGKESIRAHLAPLADTSGMPARIAFAVQHEARGLADAIRLGGDFVRHGALAVALPDNLFVADLPALRQVLDVARSTGKSTVAVTGIAAEDAARRGATAVYSGALDQGSAEFRITYLPGKGAKSASFDTGGSPMAYTGVGRYAFDASLWPAITEVSASLSAGEELDDIPVMQALLRAGLLTGCLIHGDFLDVGVPAGYEEATQRLTAPSTRVRRSPLRR